MPKQGPTIAARIRNLLRQTHLDFVEELGAAEWPRLRVNLSVWEFIRLRKIIPGEIQDRHTVIWKDLGRPSTDPRHRWAKSLLHGFELIKDAREIWVAEFGDPSFPEGLAPNLPDEGMLFYVDPSVSFRLTPTLA